MQAKSGYLLKKRRTFLVNCIKIDVRSPAVAVAAMRDEGDMWWHEDRIGRTDGGRLHQF
jgi:hypothetical protein